MVGWQLRDLRVLDPQLSTSYPSAILARETCLVVNLEFIKVLFMPAWIGLLPTPFPQNATPCTHAQARVRSNAH